MLTVLAIAAKKKLIIDHYEDKPVAIVAANETGNMMVTTITLTPKITFSDKSVSQETINRLHDSAHKHCFIANSLISDQIIQPRY
jgi:organic hydroperoxide reductase OsmC/OhrA